ADAGGRGDRQVAPHRFRIESELGGDALLRQPLATEPQDLSHFDHRDLAIHPRLLVRDTAASRRRLSHGQAKGGEGFGNLVPEGGKVLKNLSPEGGKVLRKSSRKGPYLLRTDSCRRFSVVGNMRTVRHVMVPDYPRRNEPASGRFLASHLAPYRLSVMVS